MKRKLRWKKQPKETGLRAVCAGPVSHDLHDGETVYATVSCLRKNYSVTGWYFYTMTRDLPRMNTCDKPKATIEEAKAECLEYVKKHLT